MVERGPSVQLVDDGIKSRPTTGNTEGPYTYTNGRGCQDAEAEKLIGVVADKEPEVPKQPIGVSSGPRPYTYTNKTRGDDIRIVALLCDADLEGFTDDGK